MVLEEKYGLILMKNIKDFIVLQKNRAWENITGQMEVATLENGPTMNQMEKEFSHGMNHNSILGNGKIFK
jgi:DNA-binding transcriptional regulator/RsmH inhibitor MraZ